MDRLLHNKRFQSNLFKWIFAYVGVLLLFSSVVTYSKYITSLEQGDTSKPAKFDVKISCPDCSIVADNNVIDTGSFRPTQNIEYYFQISPSFEVNTNLKIITTVDPEFYIQKLELINLETNEIIKKVFEKEENGDKITSITALEDKLLATSQITVNQKINFNTMGYKLTIKFNKEVDEEYKKSHPYNQLARISYYAEQITQ